MEKWKAAFLVKGKAHQRRKSNWIPVAWSKTWTLLWELAVAMKRDPMLRITSWGTLEGLLVLISMRFPSTNLGR